MDEPIFIARQDTLEDVQRDTQAILADTTAIGEDVPQIRQTAEENKAAAADIQGKSERILKSPKGLQVFITRNASDTLRAMTLEIDTDPCAFAEAGGKVHIFGNTQARAREHFLFDIATMTLERQPELPFDFYGYGMALSTEDGRVHLLGGSGGERKHWIWDNGNWTEGADMERNFAHGCAVANDNDIFFIPGEKKELYEWNAETNTNTYRKSLSAMTYNFYDGILLNANGRLYFGCGYDVVNAKEMTTMWQTESLTVFTVSTSTACSTSARRNMTGTGEYLHENCVCVKGGQVYRLTSAGSWETVKKSVFETRLSSVKSAWKFYKNGVCYLFAARSIKVPSYYFSIPLPKGAAVLCGTEYACPMLRKKGDAYIVDETGITYLIGKNQYFYTESGLYGSCGLTFYIDGEETT